MNTKAFLVILMAVLMLGGSLGGAFAGGLALGKSQGEDEAQSGLPAQSTASLGQQPSGQPSGQSLNQLRERIRSGEASQEDLAQLRQQLQSQFGQSGGGQGLAGQGGLTGTIEKIEGNTVTVNTPQGPLQAAVGENTTIQMFVEGTLADLPTGVRVTVIGQRGENGIVEARSILLIPEGTGGLSGGGLFSENRFQRDQQSP